MRSLILTASFLALTVSRVVAQSTPDEFFETRIRPVLSTSNKDVSYDRFVKLQLAADLVPGASRSDMRALGIFALGRRIIKMSGFRSTWSGRSS